MNGAGRRRPRRTGVRPWQVAAVWCLLLAPLTQWGLPTSADDAHLFAGEPAWPAERYQAAAALRERAGRQGGADTDLNPIADGKALVDITADEAGRAEILRRFRLFSRQPDEMITFMALQRMRPRALDLDPKLYQYGGAWIYGVGAALAGCGGLGLVTLSGDAGVYLEHPEAFARFYVVARVISLFAAGALLVACFRLGRYFTGRMGGWAGMLLVAANPLAISGALEAKPHVASAVAMAWATVAGLAFLRRAREGTALRLGIWSGLAAGLVLTGVSAFAVLLIVAVLASGTTSVRHGRGGRMRLLAFSVLVAAIVFAATNPYLVGRALRGGDASLASNLGNSTAMYSPSRLLEPARLAAGAMRVAELLSRHGGGLVMLVGALAAIVALKYRPRSTLAAGSAALALTLLATALAAGKPEEFGRFLVWPAAALCVACGGAIGRLSAWRGWAGLLALIAALGFTPTAPTVAALVADSREAWGGEPGWKSAPTSTAESEKPLPHGQRSDRSGTSDLDTRRAAAAWLLEHMAAGDRLGVIQEPAPYCTPPVDLARRRVVLIPRLRPDAVQPGDLPEWIVICADGPTGEPSWGRPWWWDRYELTWQSAAPATPLVTWADKPVFVYRIGKGRD